MLIDLTNSPLSDAYTGAGTYLVAINEDHILAIRRIALGQSEADFDAAVFSFTRDHARCRVVLAIGSGYSLSWPDGDDAGDLRWSAEQAAAAWRVRDLLNYGAPLARAKTTEGSRH